jgi:hypothetical protein
MAQDPSVGHNQIEADHGRLKAWWLRAMRELKQDGSAGWLSLGMRSFRTFGAATTSWRARSQRTGGWLQRSTSSPWPSDLGVGSGFNMPRVAGTQ